MLFAIKIFDVPDSGPLRDIHREAHLDYLRGFDAQTLFAGPFLTQDLKTELGSHRMIEFDNLAAAEQHVADEPYITGGVQNGYTIHEWLPDTANSWRDCPRAEGNVQFMIEAMLAPDVTAVPEGMGLGREAFLRNCAANIITSGWLLDQGEAAVGTLMILDVPDLAAAEAIWNAEPLRAAGLYSEINFYGWRFGRVLDRFK